MWNLLSMARGVPGSGKVWQKCAVSKVCEVCAQVYQPSHTDQRFCSKACMGINKRRTSRVSPCPRCGTEVRSTPSTPRQFCSLKCRREYGIVSAAAKGPATTRDIILAAGWYEGEGNCYGTVHDVHASIGQKDPWMLHQLVERFGGKIYRDGGVWHGSPTPDKWIAWGPRAIGFLMTIYSLLSPRRKAQIRTAFSIRGFLRSEHHEPQLPRGRPHLPRSLDRVRIGFTGEGRQQIGQEEIDAP